MARRSKGMTEAELSSLVKQQIEDSISYDNSELSKRRADAIDYYAGKKEIIPFAPGHSSVTSRDLSDAIGWILPGLMRVFAASENIVCYEPQMPQDEPAAAQASDYVNYVFMRECRGYRVLRDACQEGLQFGNGIFKFWWDTSRQYECLDYSGLDDAAFTMLVNDDDVEVLEHTAVVTMEQGVDPQTGQPGEVEATTHDVRIKRITSSGRLRVECLPPEEFLIERGAKSIEDARFTCHRSRRTRQSMIDDGYDRETVMSIGAEHDLADEDEAVARWDRETYDRNRVPTDPLMEEIDVFEAYLRCDYDGDGHAEWRKVVTAGLGGDRRVLANDEWSDDVPFADAVPMPEPHRWQGRSLFDELEDIQQVKTVLLRQTLNNLYLTNAPQREALANSVENPDELVNPTLGGTIWVKQLGATREIATPFVAEKSYSMLEYQDSMAEKRTGVSRQSMALDPEALANQTATGQAMAQSAAYAKVELYARNIAELGLKRLFQCILKLIVRHQDRPRMIRLRDQWVQMDPRSWNANMDATVSVGLGSGSRDRDMMLLQQVAQKQELIIQQSGPTNPIANIQQYANTLRKMVEASGLRSPDQYFKEINEQDLQGFMQQQQGQQEDPKAQAELQKAQVEQQKAQAQIQLEHAKAQAQAQLEQQKAQAQMELERERNAMEMQAMREKAQLEMQIAREKAEYDRNRRAEDAILDAQLRREEMALEAQLTQEANRMNAAVAEKKADANIQQKSVKKD